MSDTPVIDDGPLEDVDSFRERARAWVQANLGPAGERYYDIRDQMDDDTELALVAHHRLLQRKLFDAGLAGICFPREYGGQGLTAAHQQALNEAITGHEFPMRIQVPTINPCAAIIADYGTDEQKQRHLPAILRGDAIWIQFLSEPSGGSDVAGALTTAVRDGDEWILNGSKVWSSGAWWSDWALCLARTNWDVPKHRGLTVFMMPVHQPGVEIQRIEMLTGSREFCQEFLTDVRVPDSCRLGDVNEGWTVGTRWMMHERVGFSSQYVTAPRERARAGVDALSLTATATALGRLDDPRTCDLIGEERMLTVVREHLHRRIGAGLASGKINPQSSAIGRLYDGMSFVRQSAIAMEVAGASGGAWTDDDPAERIGIGFLVSQTACIGGGTTEISRNVIAERVLGMPREPSPDRDTAFREVARRSSTRR